jgi:hypothetical protein
MTPLWRMAREGECNVTMDVVDSETLVIFRYHRMRRIYWKVEWLNFLGKDSVQLTVICCICSFGCFPGVRLWFADVSEPSISSIFKGCEVLSDSYLLGGDVMRISSGWNWQRITQNGRHVTVGIATPWGFAYTHFVLRQFTSAYITSHRFNCSVQ